MKLEPLTRWIGSFGASGAGPLVVVVGGLHGNEPAGVVAARRVLGTLKDLDPPFRGKLVALAGNLVALGRGSRYVDEDLNRIWFGEDLETSASGSVEQKQRRALFQLIHQELAGSGGHAYFLDLHTTSAPGSPFSILADTLSNRRLAQGLPAPMVLGLEEHLDGTLLNFINDLGYVAIGFEGGQHEAPSSVEVHELAIWRMLVMAGCVDASRCPARTDGQAKPGRGRGTDVPEVVEIRYRHPVVPGDGFVMEPGFQNLQRIRRGELMARDRNGEIRASEDGCVLMPLYQSQGDDGFFLVRPVRPVWLRISFLARKWRLERLLRWMPGIRPHPVQDGFLVNPVIARWFVVEVFHLLGFRRRRAEAGRLLLTRRRETPSRSASPEPL